MMNAIYEYQLQPGRTVLDMPEGAQPLTVQMQGDALCLWAIVDPRKPQERRFFDVVGIGHAMPSDPGNYVGTVQMYDGSLVWHVFDAYPPNPHQRQQPQE